MSTFEFVFSLFGLLLGFSLVEVLGGLGRVLRLKAPRGPAGDGQAAGGPAVRIGWQTPLLGLFVMADLISFWMIAWTARDSIPASYGALLFGLLVTGLYYLAAMLVFPARPEEWPELDAYYALHKRQVIGGVVACNLITHAAETANGGTLPSTPLAIFLVVIFYVLAGVVAFVRNKAVNVAALAVLLGLYVMAAVT